MLLPSRSVLFAALLLLIPSHTGAYNAPDDGKSLLTFVVTRLIFHFFFFFLLCQLSRLIYLVEDSLSLAATMVMALINLLCLQFFFYPYFYAFSALVRLIFHDLYTFNRVVALKIILENFIIKKKIENCFYYNINLYLTTVLHVIRNDF